MIRMILQVQNIIRSYFFLIASFWLPVKNLWINHSLVDFNDLWSFFERFII